MITHRQVDVYGDVLRLHAMVSLALRDPADVLPKVGLGRPRDNPIKPVRVYVRVLAVWRIEKGEEAERLLIEIPPRLVHGIVTIGLAHLLERLEHLIRVHT